MEGYLTDEHLCLFLCPGVRCVLWEDPERTDWPYHFHGVHQPLRCCHVVRLPCQTVPPAPQGHREISILAQKIQDVLILRDNKTVLGELKQQGVFRYVWFMSCFFFLLFFTVNHLGNFCAFSLFFFHFCAWGKNGKYILNHGNTNSAVQLEKLTYHWGAVWT